VATSGGAIAEVVIGGGALVKNSVYERREKLSWKR
jgi:hypothetical protein